MSKYTTAEQVYDKFVELEKKMDLDGMVQLMMDISGEKEPMNGAHNYYNAFSQSVANATGDEKEKKNKMVNDLIDKMSRKNVELRFDAGKKMAEYEDKIINGEVPDTEHYVSQKKVVKAIAHDMVHFTEIGDKYMGLDHASKDLFSALRQNGILTS